MTDSTKFNLDNIFLAVTKTPGEHLMAVARVPRKGENGEQLYQMIHRKPPEDELRSPAMTAEQTIKALVKIIDMEIYEKRRKK